MIEPSGQRRRDRWGTQALGRSISWPVSYGFAIFFGLGAMTYLAFIINGQGTWLLVGSSVLFVAQCFFWALAGRQRFVADHAPSHQDKQRDGTP